MAEPDPPPGCATVSNDCSIIEEMYEAVENIPSVVVGQCAAYRSAQTRFLS
jgi:hypothetical protein